MAPKTLAAARTAWSSDLRKRIAAKVIVLALIFGASSLLAQQPQPSAATQSGQASSEIMAKGRLDGTAAAPSVGTGG